jgi:hypothetical protein
MGWRSTLMVALAVGAVGFTAGRVFSQDAKPAGPSPEDMQKMMAELAKPVKQHEQIATTAGNWDNETTMWMAPGAEPTKTKGTSSAKSILNGLWLVGEHKGEMMGAPFEGFEVFGYDKETKKYFGLFVCSINTHPEIVWGTSDDDGKTITLVGEETQCMGMTYTPKWVIKNADTDHHTFEHWSKMAGSTEWTKEIEIHSTRRK